MSWQQAFGFIGFGMLIGAALVFLAVLSACKSNKRL